MTVGLRSVPHVRGHRRTRNGEQPSTQQQQLHKPNGEDAEGNSLASSPARPVLSEDRNSGPNAHPWSEAFSLPPPPPFRSSSYTGDWFRTERLSPCQNAIHRNKFLTASFTEKYPHLHQLLNNLLVKTKA